MFLLQLARLGIRNQTGIHLRRDITALVRTEDIHRAQLTDLLEVIAIDVLVRFLGCRFQFLIDIPDGLCCIHMCLGQDALVVHPYQEQVPLPGIQ